MHHGGTHSVPRNKCNLTLQIVICEDTKWAVAGLRSIITRPSSIYSSSSHATMQNIVGGQLILTKMLIQFSRRLMGSNIIQRCTMDGSKLCGRHRHFFAKHLCPIHVLRACCVENGAKLQFCKNRTFPFENLRSSCQNEAKTQKRCKKCDFRKSTVFHHFLHNIRQFYAGNVGRLSGVTVCLLLVVYKNSAKQDRYLKSSQATYLVFSHFFT